jgi:glycosyltransferase involved in cell wall biosynthesis
MQNRRRIPKLVSFRLVELPILINSAAIHYTSEAERKEAALLDARLAEHESAVIPLPVALGDLSEVRGQRSEARRIRAGDPKVFRARYPWLDSRRIILFLSRIDRKKGLELLIDAFVMVRENNKGVALVIAGDGEESYVRELRERAKSDRETTRLQDSETTGQRDYETTGQRDRGPAVSGQLSGGPSSDVIWTGHLSGEMKAAALAAADVFVLPSASENFGIAAAESLAAGVPTIVSEEVALSSDIRRYDAGVVVKRDVQQLASAISDLLSNGERAASLAANGRRLAEERYSPEAVGRALHELYQKIICKREKGEGRQATGLRDNETTGLG